MEELAEIPELNRKAAEAIHDFFASEAPAEKPSHKDQVVIE